MNRLASEIIDLSGQLVPFSKRVHVTILKSRFCPLTRRTNMLLLLIPLFGNVTYTLWLAVLRFCILWYDKLSGITWWSMKPGWSSGQTWSDDFGTSSHIYICPTNLYTQFALSKWIPSTLCSAIRDIMYSPKSISGCASGAIQSQAKAD